MPTAWEIIRKAPQHVYQILTKRPERISANLRGWLRARWASESHAGCVHLGALHEVECHRRCSMYSAREGPLGDHPSRRALSALTRLLDVTPYRPASPYCRTRSSTLRLT